MRIITLPVSDRRDWEPEKEALPAWSAETAVWNFDQTVFTHYTISTDKKMSVKPDHRLSPSLLSPFVHKQTVEEYFWAEKPALGILLSFTGILLLGSLRLQKQLNKSENEKVGEVL